MLDTSMLLNVYRNKALNRKLLFIIITMVQVLICSCSNTTNIKSDSCLDCYGIVKISSIFGSNPIQNNVCETSIIEHDNALLNIYDEGFNGSLTFGISNSTDFYQKITSSVRCNIDVRFPYTIYYERKYYTFGWQYKNNYLESYNIYIWSSDDGIHWIQGNNNNPVLSASEDKNSIWHFIWNVAVAIDDKGVFNIVAECSPDGENQKGVGLGYSYASYENGVLDFNKNRSEKHIVKGGGNPFLYYSKKYQTFLILHGIAYTKWNLFTGDYWWITASFYNKKKDEWETDPEFFAFGKEGIHVCDPHAAEVIINKTTYTRIVFSYNQTCLYSIYLKISLDELLYKMIIRCI